MQIAYLINQYPKVSHTFIRREIQALERRGVEVHRFAIRGWDESQVDVQDQAEQALTRYVLQGGAVLLVRGLLTSLLRAPLRTLSALRLAVRLSRDADRPLAVHLVYWAEACVLARWVARSQVSHMHAHFGTNAAAVAMLVHCLGGPSFSFTVHGPEEFDKPHALKLADKARAARFVVAVSSFGRSQLWRWLARDDWAKVRVVHCGIDKSFAAAVAPPVPAAPRLVCVGRLCEQKGQLLLVEAAGRLAAQGVPFELVLAGDGEMRATVQARIDALHLQAQVRITGWVDGARVREEIAAARALVLPSFAEGLPVVLMEAMAMRRPVITTAIAGIPELVRDGREGWLVAAGDLEALTDAMRECLSAAPATLDAMGEQARERIAQRHDIDREAERLAAAFNGAPEAVR